jgi:hypothetical protein
MENVCSGRSPKENEMIKVKTKKKYKQPKDEQKEFLEREANERVSSMARMISLLKKK